MVIGVDNLQGDMRLLADERFPIWEAWGADRKALVDVCYRVGSLLEDGGGKGGWTYEFMCEGGRWMGEARSPAHRDRKAQEFQKAIAYYGIAKFPFIDSILKKDAYGRQRQAVMEQRKYLPYKEETVKIPFMDSEITAYFASPPPQKEIILPEAVLLTGGLEDSKEDMHHIVNNILDAGMACLTIDMPGTGESAWKMSRDSGDVYAKAVKYLASRGDVDTNRLGMFGIGFGGYWALWSAAMCPEIKAVVNCGTPVHRAFIPDIEDRRPEYMKRALAFAQGYDQTKPEEVKKALDNLQHYSLLKRDQIRGIGCPVLSINGTSDPYVPIEDLFILREECGIAQEEWTYQEDKHCAPHNYNEWMPRAVRWMANHIGGPDRIPRPDIAAL